MINLGKTKLETPEHTCNECAYWNTSKCPFLDDAYENLLKVGDEACAEFYPKKKQVKEEPEEELVRDQGESDSSRKSQADKLVKLCLQNSPTLFHDQHQIPYVKVGQSNVSITLKVRSSLFKKWLAGLLWRSEEKAPNREALYGALNVLASMALFDGQEYQLYNRVASAEDGFWIDMSNDRWRAIKVTSKGWEIVDDPPILFTRYRHQQPMVKPIRGGDPKRFLDFVNVSSGDHSTRLTLLCTAISFMIPSIPHPILILYGIQGSGKTWLFRLIRSLIDPSIIEVLTLPRSEKERVQQLSHHWCAFYDNITRFPSWMSDSICRAATGTGFTKRMLYSNDEDIIYSFKRCVGLNGINIAAKRGDLLDRGVLIGLENIPEDERRTEEDLLNEFKSCKGEILGGFLDTLVKTLRIYPTIKLKTHFRMADFTKWGCAIAIALGYSKEGFIQAYGEKVERQIKEAALATPVATIILNIMDLQDKWEGTPTELYRKVREQGQQLGIDRRQKAFPKAPNALTRQLNELTPSLQKLGLKVQTGIHTGDIRKVILKTVKTVSQQPKKHGKIKDTNEINAFSHTLSNRIGSEDKKVDFIFQRLPRSAEKCDYCGVRAVEYTILDVESKDTLRKCARCFQEMREQYRTAKWQKAKGK